MINAVRQLFTRVNYKRIEKFQATNANQSHVKMAASASGTIRGWMATDANAHLTLLEETAKVNYQLTFSFAKETSQSGRNKRKT